ncbi:acetyltransferase [Glutamicibacter sp.]|uniref:putative acetyltransferase n=1 Tax=Glutamicibacter sp. TaxID=1931995 RepID=UPI0028BF2DAD|nr:acetyltransferase [Glutamicibacter sp.]
MLNFNDLSPGDRIVLRFRLSESTSSGATLSDAIGYVVEVADEDISVETRHGIVKIQRSLITHAKRVPPAPPRRGSRLTSQSDQG